MDLSDIVRLLYKNEIKNRDIILRDDGDGVYIDHWNAELLGDKPTEQQLLDRQSEIQSQFYNDKIAQQRAKEYPTTDELIVAMWEKVVEGRTGVADTLEAKRQAVKAKYPKQTGK